MKKIVSFLVAIAISIVVSAYYFAETNSKFPKELVPLQKQFCKVCQEADWSRNYGLAHGVELDAQFKKILIERDIALKNYKIISVNKSWQCSCLRDYGYGSPKAYFDGWYFRQK
jgi:hypothetical protein